VQERPSIEGAHRAGGRSTARALPAHRYISSCYSTCFGSARGSTAQTGTAAGERVSGSGVGNKQQLRLPTDRNASPSAKSAHTHAQGMQPVRMDTPTRMRLDPAAWAARGRQLPRALPPLTAWFRVTDDTHQHTDRALLKQHSVSGLLQAGEAGREAAGEDELPQALHVDRLVDVQPARLGILLVHKHRRRCAAAAAASAAARAARFAQGAAHGTPSNACTV